MLNDSLLKSNFIGRDGFRWWVGQIPQDSVQGDQIKGAGWGNRSKVRILGYHPFDETLKDEDLPWALVTLPTTAGSGARGRGENVKLSQGDIVTGYFADGDNAQIPVINGILGRTEYVSTEEFKAPFIPFTGYTDTIEPKDEYIPKNESNEQNERSQKAPRNLSRSKALDIGPNERPASSSYGLCLNLATGNGKSPLDGISTELGNLTNTISEITQGISNGVGTVEQQIGRLIDETTASVTNHATGMVGSMTRGLYEALAPVIKSGLITLYDITYNIVYAATQSATAAHLAGVAAQNALYVPIQLISDALPCVINNIVNSLGDVIKDLVSEIAENVTNFVTCIAEQSIGSIANHIINEITDFMSPLIDGIDKILFGFDFVSFLRSNAEGLLGIISALSCEETANDLDRNASKLCIGDGPKDSAKIAIESVLELANIADSSVQELIDAGQQVSQITGSLGVWDFNNPSVSVPGFESALGSCYAGPPLECATGIELFGGGGFGALGELVLGNLVGEAGQETASVLGINVLDSGSGYIKEPMVSISDNCDEGYGAVAKAIIEDGEVIHIYIVSEGENYPVGDGGSSTTDDHVIDEIVVISPGNGYESGDIVKVTVRDDADPIEFEIIVDENGTIVRLLPINNTDIINNTVVSAPPIFKFETETGTGAKLSVKLKRKPEPVTGERQQLQQVIDCIS